MRKTIGLLLLAGALAVPSQATAQSTDTDQILALARVVQQLTIVGDNNLEFGDVFAGGPAVVVATTDAGTAGNFTVSGEIGEDVDVDVTQNPTVLTGPGTDISVSLNYDTFDGTTTSALDPAVGGTVTVPAAGSFVVRVGGNISAPGGQASGNYQATIEVTVTYVSL